MKLTCTRYTLCYPHSSVLWLLRQRDVSADAWMTSLVCSTEHEWENMAEHRARWRRRGAEYKADRSKTVVVEAEIIEQCKVGCMIPTDRLYDTAVQPYPELRTAIFCFFAAKRVLCAMAMLFVPSFVCSFVRLFVCRQNVLMAAGAYRVGYSGRTDLLMALYHHFIVKCNSNFSKCLLRVVVVV